MERSALPLAFVLSGTINVLLMKWSDISKGECSDGKWRTFLHPVLQTALMFLGELLCFVLYKIVFYFLQRRQNGSEDTHFLTRGGREFSPKIFLFPAFCDVVATMMLFTGLYLTFASSFQMIRGIAIIFVGLFSSIYLNQTLITRHWMAMSTIVCAIIIIISIDVHRVYYDHATLSLDDANAILTGDLLIICAQVFHAAQYVYEEKHVREIDVPALQATGWQGIIGLPITALLYVAMNFLPVQIPFGYNSRGVFDDFTDILPQVRSNVWLIASLGTFVISSAVYNFAALSIVKFSSSANRILADGLRIMLIWLTVLLLEWEAFNFISLLGFVILSMGTIEYRNAIFLEWYRSLLARIARRRYADLSVDTGNDASAVGVSRPADVI